jgi:hypothetical protein
MEQYKLVFGQPLQYCLRAWVFKDEMRLQSLHGLLSGMNKKESFMLQKVQGEGDPVRRRLNRLMAS